MYDVYEKYEEFGTGFHRWKVQKASGIMLLNCDFIVEKHEKYSSKNFILISSFSIVGGCPDVQTKMILLLHTCPT